MSTDIEGGDDGRRRDRMLSRLRAVAGDPVRLDLIEVLRLEGPLTDVELRRLVPSARRGLQAHLRGLVEGEWVKRVENEEGTASWDALGEGVEWDESDSQDDPELAFAMSELMWTSSIRRIDRQQDWREQRDDGRWPQAWTESWIGRDYTFWLTPHDLDDLDEQLSEVFERFRARSDTHRGSGELEPDLAPVFLAATGFPVRFGKSAP